MTTSMMRNSAAVDAAFRVGWRVTLAGSTMLAWTMSTHWLATAFSPRPLAGERPCSRRRLRGGVGHYLSHRGGQRGDQIA